MRRAGAKEDKVSLLLKRDLLIGKKEHKVAADKDVEGRNGVGGRPCVAGLALRVRPSTMAWSLLASVVSGLAAGWYPARRAVKVEVVAAGTVGAAASQAPSPEQQRRESLAQQASQDPVVREALDLFNGKVVGVREVES